MGRRSQVRLETLARRSESRRRAQASAPYVTLAVALVLAMAVGLLHNRWRAARRPNPLLTGVRTVLYPGQTTVYRAHTVVLGAGTRISWQWPWAGHALARENAQLRDRVARLEIENQRLRAAAESAVRLRAALGFIEQKAHPKPIAVPVVGLSASSLFDTLTIGRGTRGGLRERMVVRTANGLVGQISQADPFSSTVLLLGDTNSGVSGYVVRPAKPIPAPKTPGPAAPAATPPASSSSSAPATAANAGSGAAPAEALVPEGGRVYGVGIVQGRGRNKPLQMDYLRLEDDIRVGDRVISSGLGGVVPADIPIGTIIAVREEKARALKTAIVAPAARAHHAREVLVLP